jgi:dimethylhistidine N-methyltransferase
MAGEVNPDIQPEQPDIAELRRDLILGLSEAQPRLSPRWLYDARGSELFGLITEQPEYYLTRVEQRIYDVHGREMAEAVSGEPVTVLEPGSGASLKVAALLEHLPDGSRYVGYDISPSALEQAEQELSARFPRLDISSVVGDFTAGLPELPADQPRVLFFPGSTIGNFSPERASDLLVRFAGAADRMILGSDLWKDPQRLRAAYDDAAGYSSAFAINSLAHLVARELVDVDKDAFDYEVVVCSERHRVEMYLTPRVAVTMRIGDWTRTLEAGERIQTECSYKPTVAELQGFAAEAGWRTRQVITDEGGDFGVFRMERT